MAIGSAEGHTIGISGEVENKGGRMGVRRYEDYEEEDDWNQ